MEAKPQGRLIWSWALYDWANSAFATTVMAGFFPLFFKKYWSAGFSVTESTAALGLTNSVASLLLALMAPALGAIADEGSSRKRFLLGFTLLGALSSMALAILGEGEWLSASLVYSLGLIGFTGALTFYDSLLVQIVGPQRFDRVSGLGYALGYLGGGLLFLVNVLMYLSPSSFGLADGVTAIRASFFTVGLWWLLFAIPLFLFVPELKRPQSDVLGSAVRGGFRNLWRHIRDLRAQPALLLFLIAYLFYIDGVNTIVKMAVDYGLSIGLEDTDLIKALLLVQFIGFPSAVAFGFIGEKIGPRRGIWFCLVAYFLVTIYAYQLDTAFEFYLLACVIGVVQGGIQSLSRSYYARLVPVENSAQYFGFFNMVGKFSAILGPALVGLVSVQLNSSRAGILVLCLFFLVGGFFLSRSHPQSEETNR